MSEEIRSEASPLRQRMIEDMCMRKMQDRTQEACIRGVRRLARFLGRSPEAATAEDCGDSSCTWSRRVSRRSR